MPSVSKLRSTVATFTMPPPAISGGSSSPNARLFTPRQINPLSKMLSLFHISDHRNVFKYLFAERVLLQGTFPTMLSGERSPLFVFGVVADVQYSSLRFTSRGITKRLIDGRMVNEKRRRAWKEALPKLAKAIDDFNKVDADFVVNLGDIIEGYVNDMPKRNLYDFERVMEVFKRCENPVYHVLGNHCRNVPLTTLTKAMNIRPYYSFHPVPNWRFVVLDSTELSYSEERTRQEAHELLDIVISEQRTMHHFHGAIGKTQMDWFRSEIDAARNDGERVVVLSHYPLADGSARNSHVIANTREVREIIERPGSPVVLCLAGHDHVGGSLTVPKTSTRRAITYITLPAILEAPARSNAYAFIGIYSDDVVHIDGRGTVPTFVLNN